MNKDDIPVHPVQTARYGREQGYAPQVVTMRAYEVYRVLYGGQEAVVTRGGRGWFSTGELIAFLYAHSFPKAEWRTRTDEAFRGAKNL